jgi:hypothetical protein
MSRTSKIRPFRLRSVLHHHRVSKGSITPENPAPKTWQNFLPSLVRQHDAYEKVIAMAKLPILVLPLMFTLIPPAYASEMSNDLLTSSAWCTFTYNKTTGYSNTTRVHFNANGTYGTGGRSEGYSSGSGGSMASQHDSAAGGRWKVVKGELFMSEGAGRLEPVATMLKRNNNGYPIIVANRVEFSQCR